MFMAAMPFLVLGGFSAFVYREIRKARRKLEAEKQEAASAEAATPEAAKALV